MEPCNKRDNTGRSSISKAQSYEEIGEFWDTHDAADYWHLSHPVEFEIDIRGESTVHEFCMSRKWNSHDTECDYDDLQCIVVDEIIAGGRIHRDELGRYSGKVSLKINGTVEKFQLSGHSNIYGNGHEDGSYEWQKVE